jgi:hypothetical protein
VLELGIALLDADWHESHEELGQHLQWLRAPERVDALYRASLRIYPYHYDGGIAIRRRCTWALADIGDQTAFDALPRLDRPAGRVVRLQAAARLAQGAAAQAVRVFAATGLRRAGDTPSEPAASEPYAGK